MCVTDGLVSVTYTKGQREQDTHARERNVAMTRLRHKAGLDTFESTVLSLHPKNSCTYTGYKAYLTAKLSKHVESSRLYAHPLFRQSRFTQWSKQSSSEMKFSARVTKTFCRSPPSHCMRSKTEELQQSQRDPLIALWSDTKGARKGTGCMSSSMVANVSADKNLLEIATEIGVVIQMR